MTVLGQDGIGQNGIHGQNGTDKMVRIKFYG